MMALWFLGGVGLGLVAGVVAGAWRTWDREFNVAGLDHVFAPDAAARRSRTVDRLGRLR